MLNFHLMDSSLPLPPEIIIFMFTKLMRKENFLLLVCVVVIRVM